MTTMEHNDIAAQGTTYASQRATLPSAENGISPLRKSLLIKNRFVTMFKGIPNESRSHLKAQLKWQDVEMQSLRGDVASRNRRNEFLRNEIERKVHDLRNAGATMERLKQQNNELNNQIGSLTELHAHQLKTKKLEHQRRFRNAMSANTHISNAERDALRHALDLEAERDALKAKNDKLKQKVKDLGDYVSELGEEKLAVQARLSENRLRLSTMPTPGQDPLQEFVTRFNMVKDERDTARRELEDCRSINANSTANAATPNSEQVARIRNLTRERDAAQSELAAHIAGQNNATAAARPNEDQIAIIRDLTRERDVALRAVRPSLGNISGNPLPSSDWSNADGIKTLDELTLLKQSIKFIAQKFSTEELPYGEGFDAALIADYQVTLASIMRTDAGGILGGVNIKHVSRLFLSAALANDICNTMFRNPFFFLGKDSSGGKSFIDLYHDLSEFDKKDANVWRIQTLRLLRPRIRPGSCNDSKDLAIREKCDAQLKRVAKDLAHAFLNTVIGQRCIVPSKSTEAEATIIRVYEQAAGLAYDLWTRHTEIICTTLLDTPDPWQFVPDDEKITVHPLVQYENFTDRLAGAAIQLMLFPLMEGRVKAGGERILLTPAVVWFRSDYLEGRIQHEDDVL